MTLDAQRLKRWLIASLMFNLFLAGCIAGGTWRWWSAERNAVATPAVAAQPRGLRHAADELPAAQRKAFLLGLRNARRAEAASVAAARAGRQDVLRLLAAPDFDAAALGAALARTREADAALRSGLEASVVEFAASLTPAEREKFASGMSRRDPVAPTAANTPTAPTTAPTATTGTTGGTATTAPAPAAPAPDTISQPATKSQ